MKNGNWNIEVAFPAGGVQDDEVDLEVAANRVGRMPAAGLTMHNVLDWLVVQREEKPNYGHLFCLHMELFSCD